MSLLELLPSIQSLPKAEKLRLIQLLVADVAREDGISLDTGDKGIAIWSQYGALEAASTLLAVLEKENAAP